MKPIDLLKALGNVKDTYVISAEEFRQGKQQVKVKRPSTKRALLIAAVIALTLLLVGCAVVYVLRMQNLHVGEYSTYMPTIYDEDGNVIPVETRKPTQLLSIQGVHMDALAEWVEFTNSYDRDGTIMAEAERASHEGGPGNPWDFPDNYHLTYGCYSQEMIDKLDKIVAKYDLKLLSAYTTCQRYEMTVMFEALGFDGVMLDSPKAEVEYADGDFHLEGSFWLELFLTMDGEHWKCDNEIVSVLYSVKDYFDPRTSGVLDFNNYTQWDYTREDGRQVLLALSEGAARIYADTPEAMMIVSLSGNTWIDGQQVNMTPEALEEIAELIDLNIHPHAAEQANVDRLKAAAIAAHEAEQAAKQQDRENAGYQEYVDYYYDLVRDMGGGSYLLWDVNRDGVEELVINGDSILSMKDGKSYKYFDFASTGIIPGGFRPCQGNVFEIWTEDWGDNRYYFYQADAEGVTFLTGLSRSVKTGQWYRNDEVGNQTEITVTEAQAIRDTYPNIDFHWTPLKYYGKDYTPPNYSDPYANHIANVLDRLEKAQNYEYALLDIDGNGVQELIAKDSPQERDHQTYYYLSVYTIQDGEVKKVAGGISHILEGGILESSDEHAPGNINRAFYEFYRYTEDGGQLIEKVMYEPDGYWARQEHGKNGHAVQEEEALSVINAYKVKRIELDMKPFSEYPMK